MKRLTIICIISLFLLSCNRSGVTQNISIYGYKYQLKTTIRITWDFEGENYRYIPMLFDYKDELQIGDHEFLELGHPYTFTITDIGTKEDLQKLKLIRLQAAEVKRMSDFDSMMQKVVDIRTLNSN